MIPNDIKITPELVAQHGLKPDEYERFVKLIGREPDHHRARHRLGDVERALLLQILEEMAEDAADHRAPGHPGPGRKCRRHRYRRRPGHRLQDGEPQPSLLHRALSGRGNGVGGILRDVFTMGARPDRGAQCPALRRPDHPKTRHLVSGVVAGIGGYGNSFGVPTVGGEVNFHPRYNGNILVNAMAVGLADADKIFYSKAEGVGLPVVYLGAKTGRDGIHGATMASAEFDDKAEEKRPTVQVGDPFTEKCLLEACLELMASGAVIAIQDMGAAGLTCSAVEMGAKGDLGIELDLDKVPCREEGMTAYEMMLSECQERMLMVLRPEKEKEAEAIFRKWGLDFAIVGYTTDTLRFRHQASGRDQGRSADQGTWRPGARI